RLAHRGGHTGMALAVGDRAAVVLVEAVENPNTAVGVGVLLQMQGAALVAAQHREDLEGMRPLRCEREVRPECDAPALNGDGPSPGVLPNILQLPDGRAVFGAVREALHADAPGIR